ncbi:glycosyl transferase family 90-domain-containing protein [Mycena haematopus]|nr:glycosyl transferase family 90-domain-containing protein [Mycena haematopus]
MNYLRWQKPPVILPSESEDAEDAVLLRSLPYADTDYPRPGSLKPPRRTPRQRWLRCAAVTIAVLGVLSATVALTILLTHPNLRTAVLPFTSSSSNPATIARAEVDALFARQSTTLAEATARYTLRTGREPPAYYADFFRFARESGCLIDEYDRVHRDFKPFYQIAEMNASYFQDMIERARRAVRLEIKDAEIATMVVQNGEFSSWLPNMTFFLNGKDEPRIAYDFRAPHAREDIYRVTDEDPFQNGHRPTKEFFAHQSGCDVALSASGFKDSAADFSGFLIDSSKPAFTTDLYPMFSMATISPCFADILYPTSYYYDRTFWSGQFEFPDTIPWDQKKSQLYWRGMGSGGLIINSNYHSFPRYRLVRLARSYPSLLDVRITSISDVYCRIDHEAACDRAKVEEEYNVTGKVEPREDSYKYKYVLDVDGATFSGRFIGLLRTGSLVFKSTIFEEYFNDWLRPYEHFVPVLPDLSNLVAMVEWANAHPREAQLIQRRGREVAERVINDRQNDCYMAAAAVEWAVLQGLAGGS